MADPPTLAAAGVSRAAAARLIERAGPDLRSTDPAGRVVRLPEFCAAVEIGDGLVMAATVDGVGSKRVLMGDRLEDLGRDLVAYNVNDLAAVGVSPLAFLDYISVGRLEVEAARQLLAGMAAACRQAGCVLLGGETAEHPGVQGEGDLDLAGFAVGIARRERLVDGSACRPGDALIGIAAAGPHASGFSLIRHAFARAGRAVPADFLAPTPVLSPLIEEMRRGVDVRAIAHVCDGGLEENAVRGLPPPLGVALRPAAWPRPAWVEELLALGCEEGELRRSVNLGIAFVLAVPRGEAGAALDAVARSGRRAWEIGEVVEGRGRDRVVYEA